MDLLAEELGLLNRVKTVFGKESGMTAYMTEASSYRIAWVTVNYHQDEFLRGWVSSIKCQNTHGKHFLYIVDNSGSISQSSTALGATIITPKVNSGYFGGFNAFLKSFENLNADFDWIAFSNPDIEFYKDFVNELLAVARNVGPCDIVAPRITTDNGVEQNPNVEKKIGAGRKLYYRFKFSSYCAFRIANAISAQLNRNTGNADMNNVRQIYMPHGACFLARASFFLRSPFLDSRVFLWGEEVFLRKQCHDQGGKIIFAPYVRVHHKAHSSVNKIALREQFEIWRASYSIYGSFL